MATQVGVSDRKAAGGAAKIIWSTLSMLEAQIYLVITVGESLINQYKLPQPGF